MFELGRLTRLSIGLVLVAGSASAGATQGDDADALIARGAALRAAGRLDLSIDTFSLAAASDASPDVHARAEGELGATLFQAHRYDESEGPFRTAYDTTAAGQRGRYAIDLGNLAMVRNQPDAARRFFDEGLASGDASTRVSAELNLARLADARQRIVLLDHVSADIARLDDPRQRSAYALNAGDQAARLGTEGLRVAYADLDVSRSIADRIGDARLSIESRDALAGLYEAQQRADDALRLDRAAEGRAASVAPGSVADLLIALYWRDARLLAAQGDTDAAIVAYRKAVDQIQSVRQDIPIAYEDGSSSFQVTIEPVYLGLVDLLLKRATQVSAADEDAALRSVKDVLELSKQAEMQDYLGDRCTVDALRGAQIAPPKGTAFLYPVLLPDRVELLLETPSGMSRATVAVDSDRIAPVARAFAESLRADAGGYRERARQLYDWLLAPLDAALGRDQITTLVVVSDGVLRLVPFGALYDGHRFVVERYGVATVTGLSMTSATAPATARPTALIAGLSLPGPVVSRLQLSAPVAPLAGAPSGGSAPDLLRAPAMVRAAGGQSRSEEDAERASLALPGVRDEVVTLKRTLGGKELLNTQFTEARFRSEASSGRYNIVHIASHGFFGGSANDSFILTYDDLLTLTDLQGLLESQEYRAAPIEILSFSACETAEGDARSPLGISGAAMKARAKSVLGTLWPVDDDAARAVMEKFYAGVEDDHTTKVDALRAAQLQLLHDPKTADPFYWAPFVLIGNWL